MRSPIGDDALREALFVVMQRGWLQHRYGCSWEYRKEDGSKSCDCGLKAALNAATPAAAVRETGLDVERLAEAVHRHGEKDYEHCSRYCTPDIAAEYARLAEQPEASTE